MCGVLFWLSGAGPRVVCDSVALGLGLKTEMSVTACLCPHLYMHVHTACLYACPYGMSTQHVCSVLQRVLSPTMRGSSSPSRQPRALPPSITHQLLTAATNSKEAALLDVLGMGRRGWADGDGPTGMGRRRWADGDGPYSSHVWPTCHHSILHLKHMLHAHTHAWLVHIACTHRTHARTGGARRAGESRVAQHPRQYGKCT